jgi:hypothetical protein
MSFKTILVHVADDECAKRRVEAAASLAEAHGARLIGLATVGQPTPILVEGSAAAAGVWAEQPRITRTRRQPPPTRFWMR